MSRRTAAVAVALLFAAAFGFLAHEATERELLPGDQMTRESLRAWRQPALEPSMQALSMLGAGEVLIPLNVLVAWVLWRRRHRNPLLIPTLTLGAVATESLLKWLVHRPRPKDVGYGFPSGHVLVSIVFFGLVLYLLWQARHGDAVAVLATAVGVAAVTAIGVSRLYLNAHWLSDILGAIAGGLAFLIFAVLRLGPQLCARESRPDSLAAGVARPVARMRWLAWVCAVVLAAIDVGARTLTNNDEARFPVLAQFILGGGDWLVPSLNGVPYVNKPPLLAWVIAAASWPIGHVTQLTAVIPSVLAGLITVIVVYRLGRELWNPTTGRYAAAIVATTQGLFIHSRVPMPDMMLTAFGALSLWALHRMRRRQPGLAWLAFYAALAAGFWTKGPAGLMPLGVALGYALLRRRVEPIGWLRLGPGVLVLAGLLAPWVLAASLREAEAVHTTVAVDYVLWYVPQHLSIMTLLTPIEHLISVMVPWAWLAPFALYDAWQLRRGKGAEREAVVLVLLWIVAVFALVSVSQQQRVRYYVPLVPPVSLLLGWWLGTAVVQRRTLSLWPFRWTAALLGTGAAIAVVWSAAQGHLLRDAWVMLPTSTGQTALVIVAGATVIIATELGLRTQRLTRAVPIAVVAAAVFLAALNHAEQRQHNAAADFPAMVRLAAQQRAAGQRIATAGIPALPVAFYLGEPVTELAPDALARGGSAEPGTIVMVADSVALDQETASIGVLDRRPLGRQQVVIGRVTGPLASRPPATASGPASRSVARTSNHVRHLAFELLCLVIALAAVVGRTRALRHGTPTAVYAAEAIIILALASFPADVWMFVAGLVAAGSYAYLRWRRLALPDSPHVWAAVLLMLALPLDVLDDMLQGHAFTVDPVWLISALLGAALLTWSRLRPATA
jgi:4-amino-4-deoxy-L-arabinose transferase-like glycosyltransferase/membrane-associated phospholipid phosphatase